MLSPQNLIKAFARVEEENWLLRSFLKCQEPDEVDRIVNKLHRELFDKEPLSAFRDKRVLNL